MDILKPNYDMLARPSALTSVGLTLVLLSLALYNKIRSPWRKLPPGPPGIPILGNVLQLGGEKWLTFTAWKKKYGPIMYLNAAGQPIIVLNTLKTASDLLDRKASASSDRPRGIVVEIMTGGLMLPFLPPNEVWHRMRRASQDSLRAGVAPLFQPAQYREAILLSVSMLTESKITEWYGHIQRAVAASTITMVYGKTAIHPDSDPDVKTLNEYIERLTLSATPGAHLVEIFPWMRYIPSKFAPWKRRAQEAFAVDSATFKDLFDKAHSLIKCGIGRPSVVSTLAENAKRLGLSEAEEYWLAAAVFTGAQTMTGAINWLLMAMVLYPEVQKRAHEELDRVVGRERLPTFEDCDGMPYMQAMVKEIIRWRPIDPLGLPHTTSEDIWYDGYFIPKGAMLIPNVWAINRDPETFGPDAHHFNPARHIDASTGKIKPAPVDTKEEGHVSFGFGRRICVGRHFANKMLLINAVLMLWSMDIKGEHGPDGEYIGLDVNGCIDEGIVVRPVPFLCNITPRFPEAISLLQATKTELSMEDY